jgi:hypothetical protein
MSKLGAIFVILSAIVFGLPSAVAAQTSQPDQIADTAQVTLQAANVTPDGRLTYSGQGFAAGEPASVTVEDEHGSVQSRLEPVTADAVGQISTLSVAVPDGLAPGPHTLRIAGSSSGRFGRAPFELQWQPPTVRLDAYTGKPTHTFSFSGSGFVPGEQVDVYVDIQARDPLITVNADSRGDIAGQNMAIPLIAAGDYRLNFVGRSSQSPVSVGFNVQGFHPWAVLDKYYIAPQSSVGFEGEDFIPGETIQVFLNSRLSQPVAQITADANGHFAASTAFPLPSLTGNNEVIFVGQQSQTEVTATFAAATPPPSTSD